MHAARARGMKWLNLPKCSLWLIIALLVMGEASVVQAQTPASCAESYTQAQEAYYAANFDTAVALLRPCAQRPTLADTTRARMYRLLSFVYLGQNDRPAARQAVESLLDLQPDYTPNPAQDRPDFVSLVRTASEQRATAARADEEDRRWVRWALGAAATTALGAAVVLLSGDGGSGEEPDPLPRPEPPPE